MNFARSLSIRPGSLLWVCLCASLMMLSACGTRTAKTGSAADGSVEPTLAQDSLIAEDFLNIMVQIESLSPWSTVLNFGLDDNGSSKQLRERHKRFGRALRTAAAKHGYAMKTVRNHDVPYYIRYAISNAIDANEPMTYTYDLSVGEVDFRRVYLPLDDGGIEPYKAMLVRGADASQLESDDSIFEGLDGRQHPLPAADLMVKAPANLRSNKDATEFDSPLQIERQPTLPEQPARNAGVAAVQHVESVQPLPVIADVQASSKLGRQTVIVAESTPQFQTVSKFNIAESGMSNYENLLANKQNVAEETLIFGDDSYVLGARNKQILGNIMSDFNPETDVVSVVGCSTGVTKIENGNAALAIGRANRVKEALLYSGIPHDKIYDEGCWSPTPNSTPFPNRGVVITVRRNITG